MNQKKTPAKRNQPGKGVGGDENRRSIRPRKTPPPPPFRVDEEMDETTLANSADQEGDRYGRDEGDEQDKRSA